MRNKPDTKYPLRKFVALGGNPKSYPKDKGTVDNGTVEKRSHPGKSMEKTQSARMRVSPNSSTPMKPSKEYGVKFPK